MTQLSSELLNLCEDITFNPDIRVIVPIGAEEKSFSLEPGMAPSDSETGEEPRTEIRSLAEPIAQPLIAAAHRYAPGSEIEIALCCDIRIASEGARYGLPEGVGLGIIPAAGGSQTFPRAIGPSTDFRALRWERS
jgi:enoyl-CoA hydratase